MVDLLREKYGQASIESVSVCLCLFLLPFLFFLFLFILMVWTMEFIYGDLLSI